jgi:hypothetical protein
MALYQSTREHGRDGPPTGAHGHLPEPFLERESSAIHNLIHDGNTTERSPRGPWILTEDQAPYEWRWSVDAAGMNE